MRTKTWKDPIVEEIHAAREQLFHEAGASLNKLAEYLMVSQRRHGSRLATPARPVRASARVRLVADRGVEYRTKSFK